MRRTLTRATAACATYALVLSLGVGAPAAADEKPPAVGGSAPDSSVFEAAPAVGESRDRSGVTSAVNPSETAHDDGGRIEAGSSLWTHVDRAFPDQPSSATETGSVGTGRLAWDRVYTRRALFRFPVELGSDSPLESAVLRTEVAWSYDCESDSAVELHRVDPFDEDTTWNDQPASQGLLDTRNVRGGHAACPLHGGVEFDLTEAYQQALDNGERHLHLRLGSADESGNTAWRRFDVEDTPPVLVVDHGPAPAQDLTSIAPSQTAAPLDDVTLPGDEPSNPAQPPTVPVGTTDLLIRGPLPDDPTRSGGERIRAPWAERVDRTTGDHRRGTTTLARGPPPGTLIDD